MTKVAELVAEVVKSAKDRQREADDSYRELVRLAAEGKAGDPDEVLALVEDAGRTADDFAHDVEWQAERNRLAGVADAGAKAEADRKKLAGEIKQVEAERDAALRQYADRLAPLVAKADALQRVMLDADRAKDDLIRYADPDRRAALDRAEAAHRAAVAAHAEAQQVLSTGEQRAALDERQYPVETYKARLPRLRSAVDEAAAEVSRCLAERDAAEQAMRTT